MSKKLCSERGSSICRCCGSRELELILDLGNHPLPAEYGTTQDQNMESFPLRLSICKICALGQLGEYVMPERIFHKLYPYLSSSSSTWVSHARSYANKMVSELQLKKDSLVLEIASNDGYLLSEFAAANVPVLGVEPANNVANIARNKGIETICNFFGVSLATEIIAERGHPDLVVANNVFAHIPDMMDFAMGLSILADETTIITIENPSFSTLMDKAYFDTIYHEHYSYLSAHSIDKIAKSVGLKLFHIDKLHTHGGSNRYWLSKTKKSNRSVTELLQEEIKAGILDPNKWADFKKRSTQAIEGLRSWLVEKDSIGAKIVGYGAAHKGITFLNAVGPLAKKIKYVVDASPEKHGRFLPGSNIPVITPSSLAEVKPTDILILPWNIADEIKQTVLDKVPKVKVWVAQPNMNQL
ncbi:class I SAM-dependent methyltransferase [Pseudomonadota bacterium]|nr:class I SAM-dependent methyltransferase [Pseudomonadota bacterium]